MGCHFLLQGIFPTQGSNLGLPRCRWTLYPLSHQGSPLFCKLSFNLGLSWYFFMTKLKLYILGKNTMEVTLCLLRYARSVCIITDDVYFDHLIKVIATSFFHSKIIMYLVGRYFESTNILFLIKLLLTYFIILSFLWLLGVETSNTSCLCILLTSKLKLCMCVPEQKGLDRRAVPQLQKRLEIRILISRLNEFLQM